MTDLTMHTTMRNELQGKSDEALRDLIAGAQEVLSQRKKERQVEALATIKRLAKENGIDLAAKKTARKRGRPQKEGRAAG
jgi:predicted RecB family endonuclease